jgi:hypothetical protein
VIVVATDDFEVYHGVVGELRDRGVAFTTVEVGEDLPEGAEVVLAAEGETTSQGGEDGRAGTTDADVPAVVVDPDAPRKAVEEALALLRGGGGRTVIGVDPGENPGIAVLSGETVIAAFHVPAGRAAEVVESELAGAVDPVVRVGDGARIQGARIIDGIADARVELVDETGTTPYLGTGARGMGDVLAAVNIARSEGEPVESREFEPTAGEIQRVQDRSRELSEDNRAIDADLARRVARGELAVEDALERHREQE